MSEEEKELPKEIWREIGLRLENTVDVQMFRSTCKLWRTLLPSPYPCIFPLKIPTPPPYNQKPTQMDYYIGEHTCYLIQDSLDTTTTTTNPVFLVLESKPDRNGFYPFRLFTSGKQLGKNNWSPPNKLDLTRFRTSFVYKAYYLHVWSDAYVPDYGFGETLYFQKLVLFSFNTNGVDLAAVAVLPNGHLAHLTVNVNNPSLMEWKLLNHESTKFDDIIYYGGRLWGVDFNGGAFVTKDINISMTQVATSPNCRIKGRKRLVEASGRLYMLLPWSRVNSDDINQIRVYELIISKKEDAFEWVEIESIGNKAFFVGQGFSFSVEIGPGRGVCFDQNPKARNGNCIFLNGVSFCRSSYSGNHDDFPLFEEMLKPGATTGVYRLIDKEFETISPRNCPQIYCYPYVSGVPLQLRNQSLIKKKEGLSASVQRSSTTIFRYNLRSN